MIQQLQEELECAAAASAGSAASAVDTGGGSALELRHLLQQ